MAELDKDTLDTLTPEERAAIEDTEYSPEELASMKSVAGDDDGDDDEDDDDDETVADEGAAPVDAKKDPEPVADTKKEEVTPAPAADPAAEEADADDESFRPRYQAQLPEDFKAQVDTLNTEMRELAQKFKDGDVEFDEYNDQLSALNEKRDELNVARAKAEISSEMSQQTAQQEWEFTVKQFTKNAAKNEGIDYRKDDAKQRDLDTFVKVLAADPGNNDKDMEWFLVEAHKRVKALHGISSSEPAPKAEGKPKAQDRKPPLDAAPKTLAQVPGSDGPGDLAGEFADIDKLDGDKLEAAIAKMTPAQRDRYMQLA